MGAPFVATYVVGFEHDGFDAGYPYEHTEHDRSFIVGFANFIFAETFDTGDVGPDTVGGLFELTRGTLRLHIGLGGVRGGCSRCRRGGRIAAGYPVVVVVVVVVILCSLRLFLGRSEDDMFSANVWYILFFFFFSSSSSPPRFPFVHQP